MSEIELVLVTIGAMILLLGAFSNFLRRRTPISEPLVALLVGIMLGPAVLGWLEPSAWGPLNRILEEAARLTLAIGLMAIALRIPPGYVFRHWRALAVLLCLVTPLMWLASGLLVHLLLGFPLLLALLVGAAVTPTDPVVASSIVTGSVAEKHLPERLHDLISTEAGINDGLAYALVFLLVLLMTRPTGEALAHWLTGVWLWEVGGALVLGVLLGYSAGRLLTWCEEKGFIERHSFLAYTLALTLFVLGAASLVGTEGILAVFVAGMAFDMEVGGYERAEEESVQEAVSQFFLLPFFVLFGLSLPWQGWLALGWPALVLVAAVLLLRRLPAVLLVAPFMRNLRGPADALYFGWFGPIGVAAVLFAVLAEARTGQEEVWVVGSLLVCASLVAHGLSATPFTKLYGRLARHS